MTLTRPDLHTPATTHARLAPRAVLPTFLLTAASLLLLAAAVPVTAQESGESPGDEAGARASETAATAEEPVDAPFTEERFEKLQEKDALILVDVYADWCPVCKSQQKVLAEFREKHPDVPLHTLQVDFDEQKKWVKHFRAPRQSTLILYRGEEQLWFGVAENRRDVIFARILEAAETGTG